MYNLVFDSEAVSFLEKLNKEVSKRIFNKILSARENPQHYFERLQGREDYKLRVGDYRVIADIDNNLKEIRITLIGHRKNVYNKV